jgi:hypothetical protein
MSDYQNVLALKVAWKPPEQTWCGNQPIYGSGKSAGARVSIGFGGILMSMATLGCSSVDAGGNDQDMVSYENDFGVLTYVDTKQRLSVR